MIRSKTSVMRILLSLLVLAAVATGSLDAQETIGKIESYDASFDNLIAPGTKVEVLASGFKWSEGPVWVKNQDSNSDSGFLLFSDIPQNSVFQWKKGQGIELYLKPAGYTGLKNYGNEPGSNGLLLDRNGRLVSCEHGDRRVSVLTKEGGKRTLVDNYQGKRLNSPNDACFKSNGDLYFTDPIYGLPKGANDPRRELDFCGVYRLATDGKLTLLTDEMTRPNGIAFSPDEKTLYVAQSDPKASIWKSFPVKSNGTLGPGKIFYRIVAKEKKLPGLPDGMKVDVHGNVWATGPGGVYVFSPKGKKLGMIFTENRTANCAWGNDGSMLYITADDYLLRVQTKTKGNFVKWKQRDDS